jgi:hypothetical protein
LTEPRPEASIHGADAIAGPLQIVERAVGADARRAFGWATVDIDRAERDLARSFGRLSAVRWRNLADDTLLGARCRLMVSGAASVEIVLLEPVTEGRIAASLARFGEGVVAVYVVPSAARFRAVLRDLRGAGLVPSGEGHGPFGRQHLITGGPPWGAHLCVAQSAGAATIEP